MQGWGMFGSSKIPDMEKERAMGLCWTFMRFIGARWSRMARWT